MTPLRKIAALSGKEVALLVKAASIIALIRIGLVTFPYVKIRRLLNKSSKPKPQAALNQTYPEQVVWAARAIARHTLGDKPCLVQALAVEWLLRRKGYTTSLHIGVNKDKQDKLLAHAWLEYDGDIIIGGRTSPSKYATLQRLPSDPDALPVADRL